MDINLRPTLRSDIPDLMSISGASFANDTHTQLKALAQDPPVTAAEYMTQGAEDHFLSRFDRPSTIFTVATTAEGKVIGFLIAGSRGIQQQQQNPLTFDNIVANRGAKPISPDPSSAEGTVEELKRFADQAMKDWMGWFLTPPPRREEASCYFIVSMSVHPDYQSKGVGSALMAELTRRCDDAGVPCWVQSSDSGLRFYEKAGFVEAGRLELDLDRFNATEDGKRIARPNGMPWGRYSWPYMERPPAERIV